MVPLHACECMAKDPLEAVAEADEGVGDLMAEVAEDVVAYLNDLFDKADLSGAAEELAHVEGEGVRELPP